ncbi:hypothetical protein GCM10027072_80280 [Streptomyces bullii]
MTAPDSLPLHALAEDNLAAASADLLRAMVKTFADALMSAEADALCNAEYGQGSDERVNHRNGYRPREWDTRAGTVELAVPKLRQGSYFPHWLLERRRRAEQALISVVATAYLLGVSTRRVEKLAETLGVTQLSKSQVSAMAKHLDEQVAAFRNRPLDAGPYAFVWVDALTQKVREGGRIINVHALIAVGVNAAGHREILGIDVAPRTAPAGSPSCARSSPAASPASSSSSPTPTPASSTRSVPSARLIVAAMPDPLRPQSAQPGPQVGPALGGHTAADHLRTARHRRRGGPDAARPGRAGSEVPQSSSPLGRRPA